ncbi:MAG: hypothetical protein V3S29_12795 [bacterium]
MNQDYFRPMATGEIILRAFELFRNHFAALVAIALLPQAVVLLAGVALERAGPALGGLVIILAVTIVMNAVALSAITTAVTGAALGGTPAVSGTYSLTLRNNLLGVIVANAITTVFIFVAMLFCMIPGLLLGGSLVRVWAIVPLIVMLVLGGMFALVVPVMVVEGRSPFAAIARSMEMIRPELMKGIAIFTFVIAVGGLVPLLFQSIPGLGPLAPVLAAGVGAVMLPLAYTAIVLLYFSVRAAGGFDRAELERDLAGRLAR